MKHDPGLLQVALTTCFVGTWVVLMVLGFLLNRHRDVAFKRKWSPRFLAISGVLFLSFVAALSAAASRSFLPLGILLVVVPAFTGIMWLNPRLTKFCDKCGATLTAMNWFNPMRFCPYCGAELDGKPPRHDDGLE